MARTRNDLTTEQVVQVGTYMWNHRNELTAMNKTEAHAHVANQSGVTIAYNTFHTLSEEMNLKYSKTRSTGVKAGIKILRERFAWQGGTA